MLATTLVDDNIIAPRRPSQGSPIAAVEHVECVKRLFWPMRVECPSVRVRRRASGRISTTTTQKVNFWWQWDKLLQ
jgi:hypothetical protein